MKHVITTHTVHFSTRLPVHQILEEVDPLTSALMNSTLNFGTQGIWVIWAGEPSRLLPREYKVMKEADFKDAIEITHEPDENGGWSVKEGWKELYE